MAAAQRATTRAWQHTLEPALRRAVPNWPELEAKARAHLACATTATAAAVDQLRAAAAAGKAAADAAVLAQLQWAPPALRLRSLATPAVANALVCAAVSAVTLPLAVALVAASLRWAIYRLRPGSLRVAPPASAAAWSRLEASLGYSFERHATLAAALDGDDVRGSGRFSWLGSAVLRLLAAEVALEEQPDEAAPAALAAAAAEVAQTAPAAALPRLVLPGPGAKSRGLAAAKAAQLWSAAVGAAYVDAGLSLDAPRAMLARARGDSEDGGKPASPKNGVNAER